MVEAITAHFWVPEASKFKRLDALNGEFARRILRTAGELGLGYIGRLKEAGSRIRVDTSTSDGPAPGRLVELEILTPNSTFEKGARVGLGFRAI